MKKQLLMYTSKNIIQFISILFIGIVAWSATRGEDGSKAYKERIDINYGRNTYIAGERIWIKAYCISNSELPLKNLSKVVYAELVDCYDRHVIGNILRMENGSSASCIQIPDTLSSGLYFIKGYTNWMKNFDSRKFFSAPVFIYNDYDESNHSEFVDYNYRSGPEIYIEGGNLVHKLPVKVFVYEPGLFGRETKAFLVQSPARDSSVHQILFDDAGFTSFEIVPVQGVRYSIVYGDSLHMPVHIELPEVRHTGYFIELIKANNQSINLIVKNEANLSEQCVLYLIQESEILDKINLDTKMLNADIQLPLKGIRNSKFELILKNGYGDIVARQTLLKRKNEAINLYSLKKEVKVNERNAFEISFGDTENYASGNFSVDIHRKEPMINNGIENIFYSDFENKYLIESRGGDIYTLHKVLYGGSYTNIFEKNSYPNHAVYPVEDLGILVSGEIVTQSDATIPAESEAILSIIDTLPDMQASKISPDGKFVFLIDKYQSMNANIDLKCGEEKLSDDLKAIVEEKFYYSSTGRNAGQFIHFTDEDFTNSVREESNRVFIQRAFGHLNPDGTDSLYMKPYSLRGFYGDPSLVVYPDEFFFLPNFREIIREIIPRVRFKDDNSKCELIVSHIENGIKSKTPLVLMDGIPVDNSCDLQLLNSDHIQRIEVQSGLRIVGNYLYNGLVAIYTTKDYRLKNNITHQKSTYYVPGYSYSPEFSALYGENISKGEVHPDFKNQLYWNPDVALENGEKTKIEFMTSDELGEYIVEITGYTESGSRIHHRESFFIVQ